MSSLMVSTHDQRHGCRCPVCWCVGTINHCLYCSCVL